MSPNPNDGATLFQLPGRQVHLDFHTSEFIPDVGKAFSEKEFQDALKIGRVNSVTLFAKCHHSWSYYPTKIGRPHPNLATDLLGRQIAACREIGVRCPVYYTVGWSSNDAAEHPDWCARNRDGTIMQCNVDPKATQADERPIVSWVHLCPAATGYRKLMLNQTRELCETFELDGLFYDICFNTPTCYCDACRQGMAAERINEEDLPAVQAYSLRKWHAFLQDAKAVLHQYHPSATIFFNGSAQPTTPAETLNLQTHLELEDLPTTWGGYDKFPLRARFYATTGKPMIAMSGKFHTTWGEFGGFKSPSAMRFEAASMIAFGAGCNFGDQLHPSGRMDPTTYRNIGHAFSYAERIEEFGINAKPFSNLAIWPGQTGGSPQAVANDQGVANMLMEGQYSFEVLADPKAVDLSRYDTIVLTGSRCLSETDAERLRRYVDGGGGLLILNESVFEGVGTKLAVDIGAAYQGPANCKIDYTAALPPLASEEMASPFLNYVAAPRFAISNGLLLGRIHEPYFDRTYAHYCSHQNTPNRPDAAEHLSVVQQGRVVYLSHPLGRIYHDGGAYLHRELFLRALARVHRKPAIRTSMPSAGRVSLLWQPRQRRYVAHLLYASPMQRGRCLVIDDQPMLHDVTVTLNLPDNITRAHLPLRGEAIAFEQTPQGQRFRMPSFATHEVLALHY